MCGIVKLKLQCYRRSGIIVVKKVCGSIILRTALHIAITFLRKLAKSLSPLGKFIIVSKKKILSRNQSILSIVGTIVRDHLD